MAKSQNKTCIALLRKILEAGGNEELFAEKIGRSVSWVKKSSCGQIPLTPDAAIRIGYETGINVRWLLNGDTKAPPIDHKGQPYTLATYLAHRNFMKRGRDEEDAIDSEEDLRGSIVFLLMQYQKAAATNRGGLFAYYVGEMASQLCDKLDLTCSLSFEEIAERSAAHAKSICEFMQHKEPTDHSNYKTKNAPIATTPRRKVKKKT